jgi:co-chaperonin GroES (HSP10)
MSSSGVGLNNQDPARMPVREDSAAALPQVSTANEARIPRQIRPLGEQIIIRVIPPLSVGSIIIPDSAKGSTHQGEKGDFVHFVEAEVVAVGPGRLGKDPTLLTEMAAVLEGLYNGLLASPFRMRVPALLERATVNARIPLQVKPGDRILYHPSVQSFDRKIPAELLGLPATEECYIVSEQTSVLAVLDPEE